MRCIESVRRYSSAARLILTANGSPAAAKAFCSVPDAEVVINEKNEGFGRPHNHALLLCETEFMVCLNDDCEVGPGWMEALLTPFLSDEDAALSCPDESCATLLPSFIGMRGPRKEYCSGHCLMVRTSFAHEHGLFDESMPGMAYCEDADLSLRYRELGLHLYWVRANVRHIGNQTSRLMPEARIWLLDNCDFMRRRWADYLANPARKFPCET